MEIQNIFQLQENNVNLWKLKQLYRQEFIQNNIHLQSLFRQIAIFNFFSENLQLIPSNYSPLTFINAMQKNPVKFLSRFSTHHYLYLHDQLKNMISHPKTTATIISNYFSEESVRLTFFCRVTFPSIYHNFVTEEFHNAAASLINFIILNQPFYIIKEFMLSFFSHSKNFFTSIWKNFELKDGEMNNNVKHSDNIINFFISSLSKSLFFLSSSQVKLFESLLKRSENYFASIFLLNMLPNSFMEYFKNKINDPEESTILKLLKTASYYPNSPFFRKIAKTITSPQYTKLRPLHNESGFANQTPIILSLNEIHSILHMFIKSSKLKTNSNLKNTEKSELKDCVSKKKKLEFPFLKPDCKKEFDPFYLELDLSKLFNKENQTIDSISLFCNMTYLDSEEIHKIKFIKEFEKYLDQIANEKNYKSLIEEKKIELFETLRFYIKQFSEFSKQRNIDFDLKSIDDKNSLFHFSLISIESFKNFNIENEVLGVNFGKYQSKTELKDDFK